MSNATAKPDAPENGLRLTLTAKPDAPENGLRLTLEERVSVRDALDMLALALTDTGYVWTEGERSAYERAIGIVG